MTVMTQYEKTYIDWEPFGLIDGHSCYVSFDGVYTSEWSMISIQNRCDDTYKEKKQN